MAESVLPPVRRVFRAIAVTVVPDAAQLDVAGWSELEAIVERALADRPPRMRRQLRTLIRAIEVLPLARYGRRFTALDDVRRTAVLHSLQDAPVLLLRRGFWGLRSLVFMGFYARPTGSTGTGYRAHRLGWSNRIAPTPP